MSSLAEIWEHIDGELIWEATLDTLKMTGGSVFFTVLLGLPLGVLLYLTSPKGTLANRPFYNVVSFIVNVLRSLPFIIMLVIALPLTRIIAGTTLGVQGVIPPLVFSAVPYFGRLVENVLKELDLGIIEACRSMGASTWQTVTQAILPECWTGLLGAITVTTIGIIGYTAMAGVVGGGGLGDVAIRYGYNRFDPIMLWATVPVIVVIVQFVQWLGDTLIRRIERKRRGG